ncbi:MAG: OmpA family protein [Chitinophagaceae bacterium]
MFFVHVLKAQNIVPNGNLEDVNICDEYNAPCSPSGWFIVKKATPGGYYHPYPSPAASGSQYFELTVVRKVPSRQYWQTMLLCPLVVGQKYQVSVKIASSQDGPNLNDIGFYFTNKFISSEKDTLLQPDIYLDFLDAKVSRLKHDWFQLKKEFTATTEAGYLVIGNFSGEDNRAILRKRKTREYALTLMIDDIIIKPQRRTTDCPSYQTRKDSLYALTKRHSGDTLKKNKGEDTIPITKTYQQGDTTAAAQRVKIDTLQLSNVLFEFDQHTLINPDTIDIFRPMLSNPAIKKIQVVGYTDDAGTAAYNKNLSAKRAKEIARLIAVKFGISPAIIQAEGKGISRSYEDKSRNRRVDIYIYY